MLKRRLIPKLQLGLRQSFRGAQSVLVVTRQFGSRRAIGDPLSQAKIYEAQLADVAGYPGNDGGCLGYAYCRGRRFA